MIDKRFYLNGSYEKNGELHEPFVYIETSYHKDWRVRGYYLTAGIAETVTVKGGYKYNIYSFTIGEGTPTAQSFLLKEVGRASKKAEREADEDAERYIPMMIEKYSMGKEVIM